jgi:hypothetical protein
MTARSSDRCPSCDATVGAEAEACRACGADLTAVLSRRSWGLALVAIIVIVALLGAEGVIVSVPVLLSLGAGLGLALYLGGRRAQVHRDGRDLFARLILSCHGDRAMAQRLVVSEAQRSPTLGRRALLRRVIERLRDDRRR